MTIMNPVIIVGGGPVGLTASILLSLRHIPHLLFERHPGTSIHPKSCGINQRTTEIYRTMGIYEAVRAAAAPDEIKGRTAWYTSLGTGPEGSKVGPVDGREIWARDAWGGGEYAEEYCTHAPTRYEILPQIRLEPILVARARELNPAGVFYNQEVTNLSITDSFVLVEVKPATNPLAPAETYKARYVIAADGGRGITSKLGVQWEGERDIMQMVSVHFHARLRQHHPDPRNFITWFTHPAKGGSIATGFLYQIGPWPFSDSVAQTREEWVYACATGPNETLDEPAMITRLRDTLKIKDPKLPIDVISLSPWSVNAISAEHYSKDRVFFVGDAAHRIPPWGALGMNSGAQDVQNLVWKLALSLRDEQRFKGLLASYDTERRPIGRRVGISSLNNLRSHGLSMDAALNMSFLKSQAENEAGVAAFFDPEHPEHAATRAAVVAAQVGLGTEFKAPGAEVGWFYPGLDVSGDAEASQHDAQVAADGNLVYEKYVPTTLPGHHLPHVWIARTNSTVAITDESTALRDLIPLDKLLLVAKDSQWKALESELVHVETLGGDDAEWRDLTGRWKDVVGDIEAVLVRPDGIIAWRGFWGEEISKRWGAVVDRALFVSGTLSA